jgi:hypothetical protein
MQYNNAGAFGGLSWWVVNNGSTYTTINGKVRVGDTTAPSSTFEMAPNTTMRLPANGIGSVSLEVQGGSGGFYNFSAADIASDSDFRIPDLSTLGVAGWLMTTNDGNLGLCADNQLQRNKTSGGFMLECGTDFPTINDSGTIVTTVSPGLSTDSIIDRNSGGLQIHPVAGLDILNTGAGYGIVIDPGTGGNLILDSVSDLNLISTGVVDTSNGALRVKSSGTEPTTCSVGDVFQDTSLAIGGQWKLCTAANTWTVQGGAAPGGSDTYIQYKSGSSLAGDANLSWAAATATLNVGRTVSVADAPVGVSGNMIQLNDNDINATPDPTCAASGAAGSITLIDADETAADEFAFCNGVAETMRIGTAGVSIGAGADANIALNFNQGTGTDPAITWNDTTTNFDYSGAGIKQAVCAAIASAGTVAADGCNAITFTGAATINTINTCDAANAGRMLYIYSGTGTFTVGDGTGNVQLSGAANLGPLGANDTLTLFCDATNWLEISRSQN